MCTDPLSFYSRLQQHRADHPHKLAVVTGEYRATYAELADRSEALAAALVERGIGPGDRLLWLGQNSHHVLELLFACARTGAVLCPVNWRLSVDELKVVLADWAPQLVIWQDSPFSDRFAELRGVQNPDALQSWISVAGADGYEMLVRDRGRGAAPAESPNPSGVLALYTAAFGGRPAAAVLGERGLYLQGMTHMSVLETRHDDVNLVVTPLFHILAWVALLPVVIAGGTNIFIPRPDAEEICRAIAHGGATTGPLMPQTVLQIAELNAAGRYDLSQFRSALRIRGWRDMTVPGTSVGGYGQTETTGPILLASNGSEPSKLIQGLPSPVARIRVVDDRGEDLPQGDTGEIVVAGPTITAGYWNRPHLNSQRCRDGWWRTGDLGRRDDNGVITFIGSNRRMIKSGGENVYPAEVETRLEAHPAVDCAALIGVPDKTWGQLVTAIVVRSPNSSVDGATLIAAISDALAKYKTPRTVHFVAEMPMTGGEKDYAALDAMFGGGNYPGSA